MKENTKNLTRPALLPIIPVGLDKAKLFKRKSKGQIARDLRRYQQNLRTGEVRRVK